MGDIVHDKNFTPGTINEHTTNLDLISGGITGISEDFINDITDVPKSLSTQESLLNDSRITPTGNGNPSSKPFCTQPTSSQKWWASVLLGFIFALISSPAAYYVSSTITTSLGGISTTDGQYTNDLRVCGPNFVGLVIHTIIFIIIVRIILW